LEILEAQLSESPRRVYSRLSVDERSCDCRGTALLIFCFSQHVTEALAPAENGVSSRDSVSGSDVRSVGVSLIIFGQTLSLCCDTKRSHIGEEAIAILYAILCDRPSVLIRYRATAK
jgi:hypothetical protein